MDDNNTGILFGVNPWFVKICHQRLLVILVKKFSNNFELNCYHERNIFVIQKEIACLILRS
jgi:hypothetical protein